MPLVTKFNRTDIDRMFTNKLSRINAAIILNLQVLGEECVNQARSHGDYTDQTGNLRSSVGYVVLSNGKVIRKSSFWNFGKGGRKGQQSGEDLLEKLVSKYPNGYALIVVAGMNYAAKVESIGRNVLSSAEHYAQAELPGMLRTLAQKIKKG